MNQSNINRPDLKYHSSLSALDAILQSIPSVSDETLISLLKKKNYNKYQIFNITKYMY